MIILCASPQLDYISPPRKYSEVNVNCDLCLPHAHSALHATSRPSPAQSWDHFIVKLCFTSTILCCMKWMKSTIGKCFYCFSYFLSGSNSLGSANQKIRRTPKYKSTDFDQIYWRKPRKYFKKNRNELQNSYITFNSVFSDEKQLF